ncbi:MAG: hypothetical protein JWQ09_2648 [Segetibacter sp.]|nr:hypothetical protein [Segetibacter sp.]
MFLLLNTIFLKVIVVLIPQAFAIQAIDQYCKNGTRVRRNEEK